ncbi:MAG: PH domain-containing protein [Chloroflexi bacterium]|nr:PH domain-containing protein [Chloroflexota bacterium]
MSTNEGDDSRLISGEQRVFTTSKHWVGLLLRSIWPILMVLASFALAWIQPDNEGGVLGFLSRIIELIRLGLFLGGAGWIAYNIIAWRTAEYSVTNLRVLGHEGLIRRRTTDTLLSSLSDIRTSTPALGSVLGFGNVRIVSAGGEAGRDNFTAVRDAEGFKRQVLEQKAGSAATGRRRQPSAPVAPGAVASQPGASADVVLEVTQLLHHMTNLRDAGAITPQEYETRKAEWLRLI